MDWDKVIYVFFRWRV